jgi:hypothetical protein
MMNDHRLKNSAAISVPALILLVLAGCSSTLENPRCATLAVWRCPFWKFAGAIAVSLIAGPS